MSIMLKAPVNYPLFKPVEESDFKFISKITTKYDCYSDFNFTSLYCWSGSYSMLNNNLIIKLSDYITGDYVYSVLGRSKLKETVLLLLNDHERLQLVPHEIVEKIKCKEIEINSQPQQYDYIYSLGALTNLPGKIYRGKRKNIYKFQRIYENEYQIRHTNNMPSEDILRNFNVWANVKKLNINDYKSELLALKRAIKLSKRLPFITTLLYINEILVGFSIHEILSSKYAICHFQKSLPEYKGIDEFLTQQASKKLFSMNVELVNWEQDLGLSGLHQLKNSYKPYAMGRKYEIKFVAL